MTDENITAAVIAGGVSLIGALLGFFGTRLEVFEKLNETRLQLRGKVEETERQLNAKLKEMEHLQLKEVLAKRMSVYPKLWCVAQTYISDWTIERKQRDAAWANEFLNKLMVCHARYGVFFSEPVYKKFDLLRGLVINLGNKIAAGGSITDDDVKALEQIYSGGEGDLGMATYMKRDFGSYRPTIFEGGRSDDK